MKEICIRILYILSIPCSIISLFYGFFLFIIGGNMSYSIIMMVIGLIYWLVIINVKPPKNLKKVQ